MVEPVIAGAGPIFKVPVQSGLALGAFGGGDTGLAEVQHINAGFAGLSVHIDVVSRIVAHTHIVLDVQARQAHCAHICSRALTAPDPTLLALA